MSGLPQTGGHSLISKFNDTVLPVTDHLKIIKGSFIGN